MSKVNRHQARKSGDALFSPSKDSDVQASLSKVAEAVSPTATIKNATSELTTRAGLANPSKMSFDAGTDRLLSGLDDVSRRTVDLSKVVGPGKLLPEGTVKYDAPGEDVECPDRFRGWTIDGGWFDLRILTGVFRNLGKRLGDLLDFDLDFEFGEWDPNIDFGIDFPDLLGGFDCLSDIFLDLGNTKFIEEIGSKGTAGAKSVLTSQLDKIGKKGDIKALQTVSKYTNAGDVNKTIDDNINNFVSKSLNSKNKDDMKVLNNLIPDWESKIKPGIKVNKTNKLLTSNQDFSLKLNGLFG